MNNNKCIICGKEIEVPAFYYILCLECFGVMFKSRSYKEFFESVYKANVHNIEIKYAKYFLEDLIFKYPDILYVTL